MNLTSISNKFPGAAGWTAGEEWGVRWGPKFSPECHRLASCWVTPTSVPHWLWTTMQLYCLSLRTLRWLCQRLALDGRWTEVTTLNLATSLPTWAHGPGEGRGDSVTQCHSAHFSLDTGMRLILKGDLPPESPWNPRELRQAGRLFVNFLVNGGLCCLWVEIQGPLLQRETKLTVQKETGVPVSYHSLAQSVLLKR